MRTTIVVALLLALGLAGWSQEPKPAAKSKWLEPTREEPPGTKYKTFHSKTIDGPVSYLLYLPPDYDRETTKRYPVLYFIPGGAGNQRGGGEIVAVLDQAIRKGDVPPLIVVLAHQPARGMWSDSSDGTQPVETVIIKDLIPHVDKTYRTIAERRARWIEGFSMGGRGAALLGLKNPELFGGVSILAGALMDFEFFTKFNQGEMFKSVYGGKREDFDKHDPYKLAEKNADAIRGKTLVRIMVGDQDTMGSQYVAGYTAFKANQQFHEHLDRLKIPHEYIELPGVGHGYRAHFSKGGERALGFYKKAFEKVNEKPPAIPSPPPAKPEDKPPAAEISGKLKSVDVEKNAITVTVGDKDQVFEVPGAAKLIGPGGNELPDRLKTPKARLDSKIAVIATIKIEKKDGREVVTEVRFRRAGTTDSKPEPPGAKPEKPPSRPAPELPQTSEEKVTFSTHIAPFLAQYCTKCHGGARPKGDLALDAFKDEASVRREREIWQEVVKNIRSRTMPPAGPKPTAAEIASISRWIDSQLALADPGTRDPGRVTMRRLNRAEYRNTILHLLGVDFEGAESFPADGVHHGFDTTADSLSLSPLLMEKYLDAAENIVASVFKTPAARKRLLPSEPVEKTKHETARKVIEDLASRAYRRPATSSEVARLLQLADRELAKDDPDNLDKGIRLALQAILVSPHFLFRIELDPEPDNPEVIHPVNDYELASRLSYFLWSSMPDDELFAQARQGTLRKNLATQVQRMLQDSKSRALAENFGGQWLQTRNLKIVTPNRELFPSFDEDLRGAMFQETRLFFEAIIKEDRSVLDFIDGKFTFVNERLARHYGIPDIKGPSFQRVTLSGEQRGGVLTHASVLTVTSHPDGTSPVKRGKWVLENLLGTPPPPPPDNDVPDLSKDKDAVSAASLRQRLEQHRANPNCASCHQRIDPLGFALENYDALGAWRDRDGKFPIDASATLPDGRAFQGPGELKSILKAGAEDFSRCLAERMLIYALGRGLGRSDRLTIDGICRTLARNDYRFSSLVLAIVTSEPFHMRRGERSEK